MFSVVSPAKKLVTPASRLTLTIPEFESEKAVLAAVMKGKTPLDLQSLMGISENLAVLNVDRFQAFGAGQSKTAAALTFAGDTYRGLDAEGLTDEDLAFAQSHLGILSGLYGLLRPMDGIEPYRLEMGTRLETTRGKNLYDFWGHRITDALNQRIAESGSPILVNLASKEYFSVVQGDNIRATVVTPIFKDVRKGVPKVISFLAKRARGTMARYLLERRATRLETLLLFDEDGYRYTPDMSTETNPVFIRAE